MLMDSQCTGPRVLVRRSVLYVPGSNQRALQKIPSINADAFIIDLEDAVADDAKNEARRTVRLHRVATVESERVQVAQALTDKTLGNKEVIVRVNSLESGCVA